jgi:ornithine--oxo-acid transaminase
MIDESFLPAVESYDNYVNPHWLTLLHQLQLPFEFPRAEGIHIWDSDANIKVDLVAGFGSAIFGHSPRDFIKIIALALEDRRPNINVFGINDVAGPLAGRLIDLCGGGVGRVHYCTDGSQAVDSAIKFAAISTQRREYLSFSGSFHGLTTGTTAMAGSDHWREKMPSIGPKVHIVEGADLISVERILSQRRCAAVVVEIFQGSSSNPPWTPSNLSKLQQICKETRTLLIVDEVFTGLGRTGSMFAWHIAKDCLSPDLVVTSKTLTAGLLPMAAVLMTDAIYECVFSGHGRAKIHGSTFSGYRLGLAVALAVVERISDSSLLNHIAKVGKIFESGFDRLQAQGLIRDTVGKGLMWSFSPCQQGYKLPSDGAFSIECILKLFRIGWLVLPASNSPGVIRIAPPYIITEDQALEFLVTLESTLAELSI